MTIALQIQSIFDPESIEVCFPDLPDWIRTKRMKLDKAEENASRRRSSILALRGVISRDLRSGKLEKHLSVRDGDRVLKFARGLVEGYGAFPWRNRGSLAITWQEKAPVERACCITQTVIDFFRMRDLQDFKPIPEYDRISLSPDSSAQERGKTFHELPYDEILLLSLHRAQVKPIPWNEIPNISALVDAEVPLSFVDESSEGVARIFFNKYENFEEDVYFRRKSGSSSSRGELSEAEMKMLFQAFVFNKISLYQRLSAAVKELKYF